MPSSAGSRHTRRSARPRWWRAASGSGWIRSRSDRSRRRNADGVSGRGCPSAACSNGATASAGRVPAISRRVRTLPRQTAPPASAARVAVNGPVNRPASATRRPAVASCTVSVVASSATNDRVANSRSTNPLDSVTPSSDAARTRADSMRWNCSACAARITRSSCRRSASTRHPAPPAARVPVGWSWVNSTTTH